MTIFAFHRPLSAAEIEKYLQNWKEGKESGVWLSIDIVLANIPGLRSSDIHNYYLNFAWNDPIVRGFFLHEYRRKVHSIFIFDRFEAQKQYAKTGDQPVAPDVRLWVDFCDIFVSSYEKDNGAFLEAVFIERVSRRKEPYNLADALFGIKASRRELQVRLERLLDRRLLPSVVRKVSAPLSQLHALACK